MIEEEEEIERNIKETNFDSKEKVDGISDSKEQVDGISNSDEQVDTDSEAKASSEMSARASCRSPTFVSPSVSPTQIGNKYIFSPSKSSTARRSRNADPFDASINQFPAVNEQSTSYFSGVSGVETVSAEVADVNPFKRLNFASNSVFGENPKFMDGAIAHPHSR